MLAWQWTSGSERDWRVLLKAVLKLSSWVVLLFTSIQLIKTGQELFFDFEPKQYIPADVQSAKFLFAGQLCPN